MAKLSVAAGPQLQHAAAFMRSNTHMGQVRDIFGYADSIGVQYNLGLSRRRAQALYQALMPMLGGERQIRLDCSHG